MLFSLVVVRLSAIGNDIIGLNILCHPHISSYYAAVANLYAPQDCGVCVYYDIVADDRMARNALYRVAVAVERETLGTKRDTLLNLHIVAYDTCSANHHTCTMVDCEVFAYRGLRMYVDTGF